MSKNKRVIKPSKKELIAEAQAWYPKLREKGLSHKEALDFVVNWTYDQAFTRGLKFLD